MKPLVAIAASAAATLAMLTGAFASATDPFGGLPNVNTTAPKGADFHDGDNGVDEERGAATYSYPIAVPPGRSGMQPSLALTYSSQAPLRGGIAVGWSLFNFPMVEVDRSSDMAVRHYAVNGARLVEVDDIKGTAVAVYRAAYDASFTRWEFHSDIDTGNFWIARRLDGSRMEFKKEVGGQQWRLTSQVDAYGNRIDYDWGDDGPPGNASEGGRVALWDTAPSGTPHYVAFELKEIRYTSNGTQLAPFAKVTFSYSDRPRQDGSWIPSGAQLAWHDEDPASPGSAVGVVMGARQLDSITTKVKDPATPTGWRDVQTTSLSYEFSAPDRGAQLRYLRHIDVSAKAPCPYGTTCVAQVSHAPQISFGYGTYDRSWNAGHHVDLPADQSIPIESGLSGQAAGATTGFMDINGDGLRDFVRIAPVRNKENTKSICTLIWRQGLGDGQFGPEAWNQTVSIPTMDWMNKATNNSPSLGFDIYSFEAVQERCTLTGQYALEYKHVDFGQLECDNDYQKIMGYHFGDYDNNGVLDIVTTPWAAMALSYDSSHHLLPPPPTGDGSCNPPCGDFATCAGGSCWINGNIPTTGAPGWGTGDEGCGVGDCGGPGNPGNTDPSPFEPDACPEWASLDPAYTTFDGREYSQWGLLSYNANNHAFEGRWTINSQLPLSPSGEEGLVQASRGDHPLTLQTLVDINGDGFLDILATPRTPESTNLEEWRTERQDLGVSAFLKVGFGRGDGWFYPRNVGKPSTGAVASTAGLFPNWAEQPTSADVDVNATLEDMNGDGLKDLVIMTEHSPLTYYPNTGTRFASTALNLIHRISTSRTHIDVTSWHDNYHPDGGTRQAKTLLFDVDNDGRADLVDIQDTDQGKAVRVRYNMGDVFGALHTLTDPLPGSQVPQNQWLAIAKKTIMEQGEWKTITDITDVDGDGLLDLQGWTSFTQVPPGGGSSLVDPSVSRRLEWWTDDYGTSPPRLLRSIDNGHGARTEYEYKPTSKLPGAETIHPVFVVTKVTATPATWAASIPTISTEYSYSKPQYGGQIVIDPHAPQTTGDDERRALQFQGFQEIEIKGSPPSGQTQGTDVVKTYDYRVDGRGYLTQSKSYIWDVGAISRRLLSVDFHTWVDESLFDGLITVVRAGLSDTRVCLNADEMACLGDHYEDNFGFSFSFSTYKSILVNGHKAFFVADTASEATSDHVGEGRYTYSLVDVLYGISGSGFDYRVLPKETKTEHQVGLGPSTVKTITSREVTVYDADHFPIQTKKWFGTGDNDFVTSERAFDRATGLVISTKRPEQVRLGSAGKSAAYTYDDNKVFAEVEINELGYGSHTYHDPGTGAVVAKTGPNMVLVYSAGCTSLGCPQSFQTEESTWTLDGFGRVVASATTFQLGETATAAPLVTLQTMTYDDVNNTVISRSLIDPREATQRWMTTYTGRDGLGRTLSSITCRTAGTSASDSTCVGSAINAVTTYSYDGAGLMQSVTMPSPATDSALVTYGFAHDSIGRETLMTRPDGSAMRTEHGPLYKKVLETGTITNGSATVAFSDMKGNIDRVYECLTAPCDGVPGDNLADAKWSRTKYSYDDFARLVSVEDAEWNETEMEHDLLGRRMKITRGTRVWKYAYDQDGNQISETSPMPASESDEGAYSSLNTYDALDRISTHRAASRGASDAELTAAWIVPFEYTYDQAPNAVGKLVSVRQPAYRPLGAGYVYYLDIGYGYDGMGRVKQESRLMNPSGLVGQGLSQTLTSTYNALGAVTQSVWDDGQTVTTTHDDRGLSKKIVFSGGNNLGTNVIADYGTRNRAGLPLSRTTSLTFGRVARSWTYDSSGHVLTDVIQRPAWLSGAPFVEAQRTYSYLPNGELQSVTGKTRLEGRDTETGFKNLNETFGFDTTHRVITAHEANTDYDLSLGFDRVGNIVTAKVRGLPEANANRDVKYHYDWLDSQAVDRLTDRLNESSVIALLGYTPMGEVSSRQWPLGSEQRMDWDGDGQLREVHTPDGTIERYAYDQNGQRIWAVKENAVDAGTRYWFGGSETSIPASGTTDRKRFIYIADGGGTLARTERVDNGVTMVELSFADALQNAFLTVKGITKPDGSELLTTGAVVTSWFHYGAFGEIIAQGGESTHRRQFNGKEADASTGLRYYGARYYDPLTLRWNSADPVNRFAPDVSVFAPQLQNLYSFTGNNPVNLYDPDGRLIDGIAEAQEEKWLARQEEENGGYDPNGAAVVDAVVNFVDFYSTVFGNMLSNPLCGCTEDVRRENSDRYKERRDNRQSQRVADEETAAAKKKTAGERLQENSANGKAHQNKVAEKAAETRTDVQQELTVKSNGTGTTTRLDVVGKEATGDIAIQEAKASKTAPLTPNQKIALPDIEQNGATVIGKGRPGYPPGTQIPPTKVEIVRPADLE